MNDPRFDDLAMRLSSLLTRRRFGRALAVLGAGVGLGAARDGVAKKKKKKKCKDGTTRCGKACVNTKTNPSHCGGCNRPCGGSGCVNGSCQGSCQPPSTLCNGECVDTETDERFCGNCTTACGAGQSCVGGACAGGCSPACPADRPCYEGKCTCTSNGQCQRDQDPDGNFCAVNPPGRPDLGWCGCITNFAVCAAGEACSFCCTGVECPDEAGFVCAQPPGGAYRSRGCCVDIGFRCDSNDDCCSNRCGAASPRVCECAPKDTPCSYGRGCCSNVCSIPPNASGTCA